MEKPVACLTIDDPMQVVMDTIEKTGADTLPVVDRDALFIGFVSKAKLYAMYRQVMVDYSEEWQPATEIPKPASLKVCFLYPGNENSFSDGYIPFGANKKYVWHILK